MRNGSFVRRPALANSSSVLGRGENTSIGDVMRKAKKDLFFRRCLLGIFLVLLVSALIYAAIVGYAEILVDKFFALVG